MKDSSFIKEVVWDQGNLFVRLKSGKFYEYENVPEEVYLDFVNADSLGKFFGDNIRDQYDYIAYQEPVTEGFKGGIDNLPKPWNFPKSADVDVSAASGWPFPTGNKP